MRLAITVLLVAAPITLAVSQTHGRLLHALVEAGGLVALYWGWTFLGERSPRTSVVALSPLFLIAFVAVRFVAACAIGLFVAPWGIVKTIRELVTIKRTAREVRVLATGMADSR